MKNFTPRFIALGLPLTVLLTQCRNSALETEAAGHAAPIPTESNGKKPVRLQQGSVLKTSHYDVNRIWVKGTYENNLVGDLLEPWDPAELTRLAANLRKDGDDDRRMAELILRAAADGDSRFRYLLKKPRPAAGSELYLPLEAYDYAVNGNEKALDRILAEHFDEVKHGRSGDSPAVWVLGYVNEWDRVKKAFKTHTPSGDGAGGDAQYAFWLKRRYLYPNNPDFPKDRRQFPKE